MVRYQLVRVDINPELIVFQKYKSFAAADVMLKYFQRLWKDRVYKIISTEENNNLLKWIKKGTSC